MFCGEGTGHKEFEEQATIQDCYDLAKLDGECNIMDYGVAYALQANDPTDTIRAGRCVCIKKSCPPGSLKSTELIFARYGHPGIHMYACTCWLR